MSVCVPIVGLILFFKVVVQLCLELSKSAFFREESSTTTQHQSDSFRKVYFQRDKGSLDKDLYHVLKCTIGSKFICLESESD